MALLNESVKKDSVHSEPLGLGDNCTNCKVSEAEILDALRYR